MAGDITRQVLQEFQNKTDKASRCLNSRRKFKNYNKRVKKYRYSVVAQFFNI